MDYDLRNRPGAGSSPYDPQIPMYRPASSSSSGPSPHPMYGTPHTSASSSLYPRVGHPSPYTAASGRHHSSSHHHTAAPSSSSSSGLGIRVAIKPEYRITPPPPLSPHVGDVPRSNFQFDFDFERRILAEAEKETPNWSSLGLDTLPPPPARPLRARESSSSPMGGPPQDPVASKYIASGLNREAVPLAVANYGDNPVKIREFVNSYTVLREMGFSSNNVAEVLLMYDNDTEKAVAHLFDNSS